MLPNWLSLVDVAFVGVALLFAWGGSQKGFSAQVAHILTFLIMGVALFFAYPYVFSYLGRVFRRLEETYLMWMLLFGMLLLAIGVFTLCSKILAKLLKTTISDRADSAYGFLLGLFRGALTALFAMILLVMLDSSGKIYHKFRLRSYVGKWVSLELVPRIQPNLNRVIEKNYGEILRNKLLEQEEAGVLE